MRKLYREFFYVPKHGKVRDRVFLSRITLSIFFIIICMVAMSATAYAYFSYGIFSGFNTIQSASYEIVVASADEGIAALEDKSYLLDNTNGESDKTYTFTLEKASNATASMGYCKIRVEASGVEGEQLFYTDQVVTAPVTVTVKVNAYNSAKVWFVAEWGSCSQAAVTAIEPTYGLGAPPPVNLLQEAPQTVSTPEVESAPETASSASSVAPTEESQASPPGDTVTSAPESVAASSQAEVSSAPSEGTFSQASVVSSQPESEVASISSGEPTEESQLSDSSSSTVSKINE